MNDKPKIRTYARIGMGATQQFEVATKSPAVARQTVIDHLAAQDDQGEGLGAPVVLCVIRGGKA